MITIKPTVTENIEPPTAAATSQANKKRIPLALIPATISIGLLIAAIYLGGRIITAHRSATPLAHTITQVVQAQQPPAAQPVVVAAAKANEANREDPKPADANAADANSDEAIPMITPQTGQLYIQVGALDEEATRRFVRRLRSQSLEPHVAPGPRPELLRVLIGPFDNWDVISTTKAQLETKGIGFFVRKY